MGVGSNPTTERVLLYILIKFSSEYLGPYKRYVRQSIRMDELTYITKKLIVRISEWSKALGSMI